MPRVLVLNIPLRGHASPLLPVLRELTARGFEIAYYLTPRYRAAIEAAGVLFRPYPSELVADDYFASRGLGGNPIATARSLISTTQALLPSLLRAAEQFRPDVILHDSMCPWGMLLARITGIPSVSSMTMFMMSPWLFLRSGAAWQVCRLIASNRQALRDYRRLAAAVRREYGVRRAWNLAEFMNAPGTITLTYSSPRLLPSGFADSSGVKNVGPMIDLSPQESDFPWDAISSKPLVYASLGTVTNRHPQFYEHCLQAFRGSRCQLVLSVGSRRMLASLGEGREDVIIRDTVPQLEILQRAAVFISHAGMNSVHESLYFGVPMLLVPQQVEQQVVAAQVARTGAGLCLGPDPTAARLMRGVEQLLGDHSFLRHAARVKDSLRQTGGPGYAADEIGKLVSSAVRPDLTQ